MEVNEKAEKDIQHIFDKLGGLDVDKIKTQGLTIRIGNKVLKFDAISEEESIENEIREEFRNILVQKIKIIRDDVSKKINEMANFVSTIKRDSENVRKDYERKIISLCSMPEITFDHARKGLSVVKGSHTNSLVWLVQGVYWPKTVDFKPLDPKMSKKMITNVTFLVFTEGNTITNVTTRKVMGLEHFHHYHQSNTGGDCWGRWKYPTKWSTPDDIICVAREAESVLENINTGSIADENPRGLPRKTTLMRHVKRDLKLKDVNEKLNTDTLRTGITTDIRRNDDNVWTS